MLYCKSVYDSTIFLKNYGVFDMNDIIFSKTFTFHILTGRSERHTDNSRGIPNHFIARMRHGSARIRALSGEDFTVSAGDVFYLPQGLRYHSYWTPSKETGLVEWESYGFSCFPNPTEARYLAQRLIIDTRGHAYLDLLANTLSMTPTTVGTLFLFLDTVLPHMEQRDINRQKLLLERATAYVAAHPDLKVSELAEHCHMSESGLYALMREYGHTTPIGLKNRLLTKKAAELLGSTDLSVEEISARLGFCSSAYFRKIIKEQTGKTPTQLRKEAHLI